MSLTNQIVRSLPYPVLEEGNLSFPDAKYEVSINSQGDTSVCIDHKIENARFIQKLLNDGKAKYACMVSLPIVGYRKLHISESPKQKVEWDADLVATFPMLKPLIICVKGFNYVPNKHDDIATEWQGVDISFPPGARLALKRFFGHNGAITSLLNICSDSELPDGCFEVHACTEGGFYFQVKVAGNLHRFLDSGSNNHRNSIVTNIISRCFEILTKDYSKSDENDGGWEQYPNLKALADDLRGKGLAVWDEETFLADKVATQYLPHIISSLED